MALSSPFNYNKNNMRNKAVVITTGESYMLVKKFIARKKGSSSDIWGNKIPREKILQIVPTSYTAEEYLRNPLLSY